MTTAFVLSGGGSLGAVQVGMLLALAEADVRPDLLVGSSVGALNAAFVAGQPWPSGPGRLADLWSEIRRGTVFPLRPASLLSVATGRAAHLFAADGLAHLIDEHVTYDRIEDSSIPLAVVATEVLTGRERVLQAGDVRSAVLASAGLPGIFPLVTVAGTPLMDGGLVNNTPISVAMQLGADEIYVLPTGYACALERAPRTALGMALHAFTVAIQRRLVDDVRAATGTVRLRVAPPLCPMAVSPADFSHSASLTARARDATTRWLRAPSRPDPAADLVLHTHPAQRAGRTAAHVTAHHAATPAARGVATSRTLRTESRP